MASLTAVNAIPYVIAIPSVIASEAKQSPAGSFRRCAPRDDAHTGHCERSEAISSKVASSLRSSR